MHHPVSLIAGASGLVGSHIVRELTHNNQACVLIVRKKISEFDDNTLQLISDFSQLSSDLPKRLPPIDHVYLCLGLRLKTGTLKNVYNIFLAAFGFGFTWSSFFLKLYKYDHGFE